MSTTCHHNWERILGQMARYSCACGAIGCLGSAGVVEHKNPEIAWAELQREEQFVGSTAGKKPSLDDYDRRTR